MGIIESESAKLKVKEKTKIIWKSRLLPLPIGFVQKNQSYINDLACMQENSSSQHEQKSKRELKQESKQVVYLWSIHMF